MNGGEEIRTGCRSGQRTDSNEKSQTAERHEGGTCTLEQDKKQACESNSPRLSFHIIPWASIDRRVLFEQVILHQQLLPLLDQLQVRCLEPNGPYGGRVHAL
jgi:hypothetical protein